MKKFSKNFLIAFLVFLFIVSLFALYLPTQQPVKQVGIETLITAINQDQVKSITVIENKLDIDLKDGTKIETYKEANESLTALLSNLGIQTDKLKNIDINVQQQSGFEFWLSASLPFLISLLFVVVIIYFMMRQVQGANSRAMMFGQSRARESNPQNQKNRITFQDVAGDKEAKEELLEIVDFLKNPRKFLTIGARIPKGVLLVGPPGTGKTLLARAVAGEAGVPFFSISGSEFVEMFVGVGASRVRDLFKKAKKNAPCIIFIDELDAVGRQRGAGMGGSNDEREQTLNQILVEMDGFDVNTNVILMAATNRPDVLDVALLRPGRFDRRVVLDLPDIDDREAILKIHARKKPFAPDMNLRMIAERTPGFTGADLNNLLNEAALLAARKDKKKVEMIDAIESIEKVMLGPERRSHILSTAEKKITAYHEAGHALVAHLLPEADPVHKVSIISRGQAAGYTLKVPTTDKHLQSRKEFIADIAVMLAGHVVEKEIFGDVTTGASSDLKRATRLARRMITDFGMSNKLNPRTFGEREDLVYLGREMHEQRDYSEKVAQDIDQEIDEFIAEGIKTVKNLIKNYRQKLDQIANALVEKETLEKEAFEAIFAEEKTKPAEAEPTDKTKEKNN
ncbi:MAG: ATP-dependent zinc metalloprotease FtsH [Candidatus Buchananbacteria bacterium]|nr:ATP-dependent zinc metalloprotease FtsH [Candidatus Buchananbacteria bacterium]